jgi:hypothetical protein
MDRYLATIIRPMEMHPYFTEIPLRSFEAMAFEGNLSEVLLALIVDPHEAEDVAKSIQEIQSTRIELDFDGELISSPIALADFQNLPSKNGFEKLKITLAQWVMTTKSAFFPLKTLSEWDQRFAVWCACAVSREAIRFVGKSENRPIRAIETAEAWVCGRVGINAVRLAYEAAYQAAVDASWDADWDGASEALVNACVSAASAAYASDDGIYEAAIAFGTNSAAEAAIKAATHAATATAVRSGRDLQSQDDVDAAYVAELIRLREVVANACMTFPG